MKVEAWFAIPMNTMVMFIWLIIRIFQLVFSAGTMFFSHTKLTNNVFQPAYQHSRTEPMSGNVGRHVLCASSRSKVYAMF
jgi:hypothetical protein